VDVERSQGIMVLIRSDADLAPYTAGLQRLKDRDVKVADIDAAEAKKLEPGLLTTQCPPSGGGWQTMRSSMGVNG